MPGGTGGAPRRGGRGEAAGMVALRFLVYRREQGVGFRWFVLREAKRRGLRGFARTLRDGSVEVIAAEPPQALEALERALAHAPAQAHVERLDKSDEPHDLAVPTNFDSK